MLLQELLKDLPVLSVRGSADRDIQHVATTAEWTAKRSKEEMDKTLFVHIGPFFESHAASFFSQGITCLVTDRALLPPSGATVVHAAHTARLYPHLEANLLGNPSQHLKVIAVTGTCGKTSVTFLLESILRAAGRTCGLMGTLEDRLNGSPWMGRSDQEELTTPSARDIQHFLKSCTERKIDAAILEASAQGLEEYRLDGCDLDVAVFTNFSQEHLEYFQTEDDYFQAKRSLLTRILAESSKSDRFACLHTADPKGRLLAQEMIGNPHIEVIGFGRRPGTHQRVYCRRATVSQSGIHADIATPIGSISIESELLGPFHLSNILAAVSAAIALGLPRAAIEAGIASCHLIPGRLERIPNTLDRRIYFDWAHSVAAFRHALDVLRGWKASGELHAVFGCEDAMTTQKRQQTAGVASDLADHLYITLDGLEPTEAKDIRRQMEAGIHSRSKHVSWHSKAEDAVRAALKTSSPGDTIVLLGFDMKARDVASEWLEAYRKSS